MITPAQIRAARALLNWSQQDLAEASGVASQSIKNIERGVTDPRLSTATTIVSTLEKAGVQFLDPTDSAAGPGAALRVAESAASLTRRIDVIEADLAENEGPSPQTPAGGMRTLERAHKREAVTKLKNRRTKLKTKK
jgi:DNA-binding XRE family transcriptional regulator